MEIATVDLSLSVPSFLLKSGIPREHELWQRCNAMLHNLQSSPLPVFLHRGMSKDDFPENADTIKAPKNAPPPELIGSCFLLDLKGSPYLVTAAHVYDERKSGLVTIGGQNTTYYPIDMFRGEYHLTRSENIDRSDDKADFGFARLPQEIVELLKNRNARFFRIEECLQTSARNTHYAFTGFPSHWGKPNHGTKMIETAGIVYATSIKSDEQMEYGLNEWNFVLDLKSPTKMETGQPLKDVKLTGISGAPVFTLPSIEEFMNGSSVNYVAGMSTERVGRGNDPKKDGLAVTLISAILSAIISYNKELMLQPPPSGLIRLIQTT
jgi:hypothetical protein